MSQNVTSETCVTRGVTKYVKGNVKIFEIVKVFYYNLIKKYVRFSFCAVRLCVTVNLKTSYSVSSEKKPGKCQS